MIADISLEELKFVFVTLFSLLFLLVQSKLRRFLVLSNIYCSLKYRRCLHCRAQLAAASLADHLPTCKIIVTTKLATGSLVKGCLTAGMKPDSGQPLHLSRDDTTSLKFIRRLASSRFNIPRCTRSAHYIYRCPRKNTGCIDFPRASTYTTIR